MAKHDEDLRTLRKMLDGVRMEMKHHGRRCSSLEAKLEELTYTSPDVKRFLAYQETLKREDRAHLAARDAAFYWFLKMEELNEKIERGDHGSRRAPDVKSS